MQEKESIMAVRCELKIPSLGKQLKILSLGKPRDAEQLPTWRNFQSAPVFIIKKMKCVRILEYLLYSLL